MDKIKVALLDRSKNDFDELVRRELANPNLEFTLSMIGIGSSASA